MSLRSITGYLHLGVWVQASTNNGGYCLLRSCWSYSFYSLSVFDFSFISLETALSKLVVTGRTFGNIRSNYAIKYLKWNGSATCQKSYQTLNTVTPYTIKYILSNIKLSEFVVIGNWSTIYKLYSDTSTMIVLTFQNSLLIIGGDLALGLGRESYDNFSSQISEWPFLDLDFYFSSQNSWWLFLVMSSLERTFAWHAITLFRPLEGGV